jgi:hypothetical protein
LAESYRFAFNGKLEKHDFAQFRDRPHSPVDQLSKSSREVAAEIERELNATLGIPASVTISFRDGSIEWLGSVELHQQIWTAFEVMSTVGGAWAFIDLIRNAIHRTIRRWLSPLINTGVTNDDLDTTVVLVSTPNRIYRARGNRRPPQGSAQGLCSASATIFSLGIAFLGFWAFQGTAGDLPWKQIHLFVLLPAIAAFVSLGLTPWLTTRAQHEMDIEESVHEGRIAYGLGTVLTILTVIAAVLVSVFE